jgi:cytochrome b5
VYDVSGYLDDHPGGAEVMLDVAGQDADEFFEDIGHSKEAREELAKHYIGDFYLDEAAKAKLAEQAEKSKSASQKSPATTLLVVLVAVLAIMYAVFQTKSS